MRSIFFSLFFIYSTAAFTQQWQDVGGGIDLWVNVMKVDTVSDLLYVGGDFSSAGGISANSIAKWDGTTWQIIGNNEKFSGVGSINDIAFFNGDLIVAGSFDSVGTINTNNIARFDGNQWNAMGSGFDDQVYSLAVFNGDLYAGGWFVHSGSDTVPHIAKWNGNYWENVGDGLYGGAVFTMFVFSNKLCIGGQGFFTLSQSLPHLGTWDGFQWDTLGNGFNDDVLKLSLFQNELFAVGNFTPWAMNPSTRISRWDGNIWNAMPYPTGGLDQRITDLADYHNSLYICGYFNYPPALVRLNGLGYDSLVDVTGYISNLQIYKDELYVAGRFNNINGITLNSICKFNDGASIPEHLSSSSVQLSIFPNPCKINEPISILLPSTIPTSRLQILNLQGTLLFELPVNKSCISIATSSLSPGIYFVIFIYDHRIITQKLVLIP